MFTGIIEGLGTVSGIRSQGQGMRLSIDAGFSLHGTKPGDSIAVNGACITATAISGDRFDSDVSPETRSLTTFQWARVGDRINLERALRFSDRLDGHLVTGHIDGMGKIVQIKTVDPAVIITISVPEALSRYLIQKGSVAVDGVSLTVNACRAGEFEVTIIPHTAKMTTLRLKKPGDAVNIETDIIGKYVERFVRSPKGREHANGTAIDMAFLAKTGFLG